ncbi:hypothetical protein NFI96_008243 [Prochilodus magdalenae]|nr:hypothetical protein NFI96_008243 [Prochilodus magdalenae]
MDVCSYRLTTGDKEDNQEVVTRGSFETTDWGILRESVGDDINQMTDCITDYINFCTDTIVPVRQVRCFPNNKPWITKDLKKLLNKKKQAFRVKDKNC